MLLLWRATARNLKVRQMMAIFSKRTMCPRCSGTQTIWGDDGKLYCTPCGQAVATGKWTVGKAPANAGIFKFGVYDPAGNYQDGFRTRRHAMDQANVYNAAVMTVRVTRCANCGSQNTHSLPSDSLYVVCNECFMRTKAGAL
jgi:ribosomal protein L37AE/L43A